MGNTESNPVRNMDKRTARREYREAFVQAIQHYKNLRENEGDEEEEEKEVETEERDALWYDGTLRVVIRKRPIFKHETDLGEFDVVSCSTNRKTITIHDARLHADMKRQFMSHNEFDFDRVFDEKSKNETVYRESTSSLVQIAVDGGFSTCIMYGQTGSGKTFTMSSIYEQAAIEIFDRLKVSSGEVVKAPKISVSMSFIEIAGDSCFDLFNSYAETQLLSGADGNFHAYPVVEPQISSAEELMTMLNHGRSMRATAATGVHDASSRSHALIKIYINKDVPQNGSDYMRMPISFAEGTLTLVDLAGSEHRIDSMFHSADRRKEGAAINASLMALKECIRARAMGENHGHNYRKSKLTMALKQSFVVPKSRTVIIATISPASKDTEHALNTLRHACMMDGQDTTSDGETRFVTGGNVHTVQVGEIDLTAISRRNLAARRAGEAPHDLKTSNGNTVGGPRAEDRELTDKERARLRRQAERRSLAKMDPCCRGLLSEAQNRFRCEPRQKYRLQIPGQNAAIGDAGRGIAGVDDPDDANGGYRRGCGDVGKPKVATAEGTAVQGTLGAPASGHTGRHCSVSESKKVADVIVDDIPRIPYEVLYQTVYNPNNRAPESAQRRQLINLMKMNGYSENEIRTMAPISPTDRFLQINSKKSLARDIGKFGERERQTQSAPADVGVLPSPPGGFEAMSPPGPPGRRELPGSLTRRMNGAEDDHATDDGNSPDDGQGSCGGKRSASAKQVRSLKAPIVGKEDLTNAMELVQTEAQIRQRRQEAAREARLKAEREKREKLEAKLGIKASSAPDPLTQRTNTQREEEIRQLEDMLISGEDLSAAAIFAINKQIAAHRAAIIKEKRQHEQQESDAQKQSTTPIKENHCGGADGDQKDKSVHRFEKRESDLDVWQGGSSTYGSSEDAGRSTDNKPSSRARDQSNSNASNLHFNDAPGDRHVNHRLHGSQVKRRAPTRVKPKPEWNSGENGGKILDSEDINHSAISPLEGIPNVQWHGAAAEFDKRVDANEHPLPSVIRRVRVHEFTKAQEPFVDESSGPKSDGKSYKGVEGHTINEEQRENYWAPNSSQSQVAAAHEIDVNGNQWRSCGSENHWKSQISHWNSEQAIDTPSSLGIPTRQLSQQCQPPSLTNHDLGYQQQRSYDNTKHQQSNSNKLMQDGSYTNGRVSPAVHVVPRDSHHSESFQNRFAVHQYDEQSHVWRDGYQVGSDGHLDTNQHFAAGYSNVLCYGGEQQILPYQYMSNEVLNHGQAAPISNGWRNEAGDGSHCQFGELQPLMLPQQGQPSGNGVEMRYAGKDDFAGGASDFMGRSEQLPNKAFAAPPIALNARRRRGQPVGAASAPFANDYTWDNETTV